MKRNNQNRNRWIGILFTLFFVISQIPVLEASASGSGFVYITVEKLTIGQGFLIEPEKVEYEEGETVAQLFDRVMQKHHLSYENGGSLKKDFYLSAIKNADTGKVEIPNLISKKYGTKLTENERKPTLGEFAYASSSGWYYYRNEIAPDKSMSAQKVSEGDVIRVQFTLFGWGQDLELAQNRQELIKAAAEHKKDSEYQDAIAVLENFDATKEAITSAYERLTGKKLNPEEETSKATVNTEIATTKKSVQDEKRTNIAASNKIEYHSENETTKQNKKQTTKENSKQSVKQKSTKNKKNSEDISKEEQSTETQTRNETATEENSKTEAVKKEEKTKKKATKKEKNTNLEEKIEEEEEEESRIFQAMNKTTNYIIDTDSSWDLSSQWHIIGLAETQLPIPEKTTELFYQNMKNVMKEKEGNLSSTKWTEYSKMLIAISALGKDATSLAGYPLVERLTEYDNVVSQGMNGPIWALIALAEKKEYQKGKEDVIKKYLQMLQENELDGGGFSLLGKQSENEADADLTAMALLALEKYKDEAGILDLIKRTEKKLEEMQDAESGEYASGGVKNLESTAWACIAMVAFGKDLQDSQLQNALLSFQNEDGSFCHIKSEKGTANEMATEQGLLALAACNLQEQQKKQTGKVEPLCLFQAEKRKIQVETEGKQVYDREETTTQEIKKQEVQEKETESKKNRKGEFYFFIGIGIGLLMVIVLFEVKKRKGRRRKNAKQET